LDRGSHRGAGGGAAGHRRGRPQAVADALDIDHQVRRARAERNTAALVAGTQEALAHWEDTSLRAIAVFPSRQLRTWSISRRWSVRGARRTRSGCGEGHTRERIDGANNACEQAIGWWVKERYWVMHGFKRRHSAVNIRRLIARCGNRLKMGGVDLAALVAGRSPLTGPVVSFGLPYDDLTVFERSLVR